MGGVQLSVVNYLLLLLGVCQVGLVLYDIESVNFIGLYLLVGAASIEGFRGLLLTHVVGERRDKLLLLTSVRRRTLGEAGARSG
jgi:hypothetical protein